MTKISCLGASKLAIIDRLGAPKLAVGSSGARHKEVERGPGRIIWAGRQVEEAQSRHRGRTEAKKKEERSLVPGGNIRSRAQGSNTRGT